MNDLLPWFALKSITGIGNYKFKRLIDHFGSPQQVLQAKPSELMQVEGITPKNAKAILHQKIADDINDEIKNVSRRGWNVITQSDPRYPALLLQIPDPPPFFYASGQLKKKMAAISIVGSRAATRYGLSMAHELASELAGRGITVVSGMARGIDTAAHQGALAAGGQTIAVLGSGLECIYPPENRNLFHQIAAAGAVISEFSLTTEPEARNFPIRNRIISGISLGTVVVEAARRSGSLITSRLAAEQNREVFAVPGSARSFKSSGTHSLIKQGAKLVENAADILEEIDAQVTLCNKSDEAPGNVSSPVQAKLNDLEKRVYRVLEPYPTHIDDILQKLDITPGELSGILLQLELKKYVHQEPGNRYVTIDS